MSWSIGMYCSLEDARLELKIKTANTGDDALLEDLIREASEEINSYTGGRRFYGTVETRYFNPLQHVDDDSRSLYLDDDLTGIVSITLGDGTVLDTSEYVLEPLNWTPKSRIALRFSSPHYWNQYSVDPETAISVAGTWGYVSGTVPPAAIRRAAIKYVRWMYLLRRSNPQNEQSGLDGAGEFTVSSSLPKDIQRMLTPFRKHAIGAAE